jgi:hypothetical protein
VPLIRTTSFCPMSSASVGGLAVGLGLDVGVEVGRGVGPAMGVGSGVVRAVGRAEVGEVVGAAITGVADDESLGGAGSADGPADGTALGLAVGVAAAGTLLPQAARPIDSATAARMFLTSSRCHPVPFRIELGSLRRAGHNRDPEMPSHVPLGTPQPATSLNRNCLVR